MRSDERVDRRIWWLTVSKAADRSSRMRTDDLESAFAIRRASVTESSAVSVEWPLLKPDCLASSLLFCERNNETWLKTTRCEGIGSRGHVVGWLERRSLNTSASVRGQKEKMGVLAVDVGWLEVLCVWRWELTTDCSSFVCEKSGKVISCYRSGGRWWRGTEERIKCSEEITHVWSAVDLVVEMWGFGRVYFSRERWEQRLIPTQVRRIVWFAPFSLCCSEFGPILMKNIG